MPDLSSPPADQTALYESLSDQERFQVAARQIARGYGLDPDRFEAQIATESSWKPDAVSKAGAQGLGQLMPLMQKAYGVTDPLDPVQSLDATARIMRDYTQKYGDQQTAETVFHDGETNFNARKSGPEGRAYSPAITARVTPSAPTTQQTAPAPVAQTAAPLGNVGSIRSNPLTAAVDRGGRFEQSADINPESLNRTFDTASAFMLPPGSTAVKSGLYAGAYGAMQMARNVLDQHKADGTSATPADALKVGIAAAGGFAVGSVAHKLASALTGPAKATVVPTADESAVLAERAAQDATKTQAADTLQREIPIMPGPAQDVAIGDVRAAVPTPDREATRAAYAAIDAVQPTPVDFTPVRQAFDEVAQLARSRTGSTPALLDLSDIPASGAVSDVLPRIQEVNRAVRQLGPEAGLRGGELKLLAHNATTALMDQLTPDARAALAAATDYARTEGQLTRLQDLINGTQNNGIPQGLRGVNKLKNKPVKWQRDLGPLYDTALEWFQNIAKLQQKPLGQKVVESLASETAKLAVAPPLGASPFVRTLAQLPVGAAIGAGVAESEGYSPVRGAVLGAASVGIPHRLAAPLIDPIFSAGFRYLANHPEGTQQWFQTAGRLSLAAAARVDAAMQRNRRPGPPLRRP